VSDAAVLVAMVAVQVISMAALAVINFCWGRDVGRQDVIKGDYP
jgi:hypothetical protein